MVTEKLAQQTPEVAAENPNVPIAVSFTPRNSLRDRLEGFTDFLIAHFSDWSKSQPPWPSPPPITFSGSERAIKGRLPHRKLALSTFLPSAPPLSSHRAANTQSVDLLSSKVRPSLDTADASPSLAQEAPLGSSDPLQRTDVVTNPIITDYSASQALITAPLISANHSSLFVPSSGSHPLQESPGVSVSSNISREGAPGSQLFRSSISSLSPTLLSSSDLACATCRKPICSCTSLSTSHGCPRQCADTRHFSPLRGLIDGSASVTADSSVIDTHLMCRQFDKEVPLPSCALDIASGSVSNTSSGIGDRHDTVPPLSPVARVVPERSILDSLTTDEGIILGELNGNVAENVGVELNGNQEHDEEGHELEEGELSDEWMDQECTVKPASAQTFQDYEESASLDKDLSDDITRQKYPGVPFIAVANAVGSPTGMLHPRYFTRSSARKGAAEKGDAKESNKKRKRHDHHDESEKKKKTSRKKRKSEKRKKDATKQRGTSVSRTIGEGGQELFVQRGNKAAVGKKTECSPSVKEAEDRKQTQEPAMVQSELPVNETVAVQEAFHMKLDPLLQWITMTDMKKLIVEGIMLGRMRLLLLLGLVAIVLEEKLLLWDMTFCLHRKKFSEVNF